MSAQRLTISDREKAADLFRDSINAYRRHVYGFDSLQTLSDASGLTVDQVLKLVIEGARLEAKHDVGQDRFEERLACAVEAERKKVAAQYAAAERAKAICPTPYSSAPIQHSVSVGFLKDEK
jgi:hypothetical protein